MPRDLSGADLSGADYSGKSFSGVKLREAKITRAILRDADFSNADLAGADLSGADLSSAILHGADLRSARFNGSILHGARLSEARLNGAQFVGADLRRSNFKSAHLNRANLDGANLTQAFMQGTHLNEANLANALLCKVDLRTADLSLVNLDGADLSFADLRGVDIGALSLRNANLTEARLEEATLTGANLTAANLTKANLQSARMQNTILNAATLTDAKVWETQRSGWSIKGVICERIYWDKDAEKISEYASREFEKLYSDQTCIELFYAGGISTFELSTLPALLQHLATKHAESTIRLKTIEETGGGAKITISLGEASEQTKTKVEAEAVEMVRAQLRLRENDALRLQIENTTLKQMHEITIRSILTGSAPQITFNAPIHTVALPSGNAKVELHQTFNDNTELLQLIDKLLTHNSELTAAQTAEAEVVKAELQKPDPDKSRVTRFYEFLKSLPKEAVLKGAGKLGEKAAEANWSSLLHQLGDFIHHLR